jgi:hypothetical protein
MANYSLAQQKVEKIVVKLFINSLRLEILDTDNPAKGSFSANILEI